MTAEAGQGDKLQGRSPLLATFENEETVSQGHGWSLEAE